MSRRTVLAALLTMLAVAACTAPEVLAPPPGTPADPTPTSTSARPRDIDVSGILPCELLTPAQLAEFRLDSEPRLNSGSDGLFGAARRCDVDRRDENPAIGLRITLAVEYGIERFSDPGIVTKVQPVEVAGYPAVLSPPPPSMPDNCLVAVDIHPGQMVGVMLSDGGDDPAVPLEQLCADVPRYAEAVLRTLLAR